MFKKRATHVKKNAGKTDIDVDYSLKKEKNDRVDNSIDCVPNKYLGIDRVIEDAHNKARTMINIYRNTDGRMNDETIEKALKDPSILLSLPGEDENDFIAPQFRIATMNENIIKYLNRSSQLLSSKLFEKLPAPKNHKEYVRITSELGESGPFRKLDTMLFASNMIMLTNNLDTNLFKQAASTLYDKYDINTDKIKIPVSKLREHLIVDYNDIYKKLFESGLEECKDILMPLRNTAGHSDISQKILFEFYADNPKIICNGEKQDAYPVIQKIAAAYLEKASQVYKALSAEIDKNGKKPFITDFMRKFVETRYKKM